MDNIEKKIYEEPRLEKHENLNELTKGIDPPSALY